MRRPSPYPLETHDYWIVSDAAAKLTQYASITGSRYIGDIALRGHFQREMAYYAKRVVDAVGRGEISSEEGLRVIEAERKSLADQGFEMSKNLIGISAGAFQIAGGAQLCRNRITCPIGVLSILHGGNNIYENGANLVTGRSDTEGLVKMGYQKAAITLGYEKRHGNIAYGVMDISLSAHGVLRNIVRPGARRLFRYINTDYVRAYKIMGIGALGFEAVSNALTIKSIIEEWRK